MSIQRDLKKEGITVIEEINTLTKNNILQSISRRIIDAFPNDELDIKSLTEELFKLKMYRAEMPNGMAEASYLYKNTSIYFNANIDDEDLEEFAIHECIHFLQEVKDDKDNLVQMGLCNYTKNLKPHGLGLNEAAVQFLSSEIIGIKPDYEKYYGISLYTPSPSYYPLECSLINEICHFTGKSNLFKSTLFSYDDFKNNIIDISSEKTYLKLQDNFDELLDLETKIIKLKDKIDLLEDGNSKITDLNKKIDDLKLKIADKYIEIQDLIIDTFADYEFSEITNLEELENFRHKIEKFSNIIGRIDGYTYFDNYYTEMMNKLEHKCNILENGGIETALSKKRSNRFLNFLRKLFKINKEKNEKAQD